MIKDTAFQHVPQPGWKYPVLCNVTEWDSGMGVMGMIKMEDGSMRTFRIKVADLIAAAEVSE